MYRLVSPVAYESQTDIVTVNYQPYDGERPYTFTIRGDVLTKAPDLYGRHGGIYIVRAALGALDLASSSLCCKLAGRRLPKNAAELQQEIDAYKRAARTLCTRYHLPTRDGYWAGYVSPELEMDGRTSDPSPEVISATFFASLPPELLAPNGARITDG